MEYNDFYLTQHSFEFETLCTFVEMWNQGFGLSSMPYATAFSACSSIYDLEWGTHLHARVVHMEPSLDVFMGSGLIDMYRKGGLVEYARRVSSLSEHNVVSWTSLFSGVAQFGFEGEALVLINQMRVIPVVLDEFTPLTQALGPCSDPKYL